MSRKSAFNHTARRFYRSYRNGNIRIGHSLLKRVCSLGLGRDQEVRLRSGVKLKLDLSKPNQAGIYWYDGDADVPLSWAVRELVPTGGTFIDCGANCGLIGLLACALRRARTIFIEPHPRLAASIRENIRLNHFESRTELIEAAASDAPGHVTFYEDPTGDDGTHSIHQDWGVGEKRVLGKIRCETLQEIIQHRALPQIDFLKIDTEGNDYAVLQGMGEYLDPAFATIIYVEMTRNGEAICKLLASRGYGGFATVAGRGRELVQRQRIYENGGRVSFFRPMDGVFGGLNSLWCGKESPAALHLRELHALDHG